MGPIERLIQSVLCWVRVGAQKVEHRRALNRRVSGSDLASWWEQDPSLCSIGNGVGRSSGIHVAIAGSQVSEESLPDQVASGKVGGWKVTSWGRDSISG